MRRIAVLDAPSNLGLRPPTPTAVPGCAKAPGALRDHGLIGRLDARDAGCLTAPRYDPGDWRPGDGVCHAPAIAAYSAELAGRIGDLIDAGEFPLVLGGDCSILLGSALAMHRLGEAVGGRIGLVFVDGHSDFRHPGNASYVGAAAGEDLALATGRGQADLAAIEGRRPYFREVDVVVLGIRPQDEYRLDLQAAGIQARAVPALRVEGPARTAQWARDQLADCAGYWVHVDVDVLDPAVLPAVDAPDPGGIAFAELELLLAGLVDTPQCLGVELTVFDPDYDPEGTYAAEIVATVVGGLAPLLVPDEPPADGAPADAGFFDDGAPGPAAQDTVEPDPHSSADPATAGGADSAVEPAAPDAFATVVTDDASPDAGGDDREAATEAGGAARESDASPDAGAADREATSDAGDAARAEGGSAAVDGSASGGATPATVAARLRRAAAEDTGPGRLRRSMDDALGGDLGPGRLRRPEAPGSDLGWADEPAGRGSRRAADDDLVPGRLHRSLDEALGDEFRPGRLRRSMDDALGDLGAGRPRRTGGVLGTDEAAGAAGPGRLRRSMDDALGGDLGAGRLRRPDPDVDDPASEHPA